jgi:hypothetical protein
VKHPARSREVGTGSRQGAALERTAVLALAGCALLARARPEPERLFEAEEFVLRDQRGSPRAMLSVEEGDGTALRLYDSKDHARAELHVVGDQPRFVLTDETGKILASQP